MEWLSILLGGGLTLAGVLAAAFIGAKAVIE